MSDAPARKPLGPKERMKIPRQHMPEQAPEARRANFDEVNPAPKEFIEADDGYVFVRVSGVGKTKSGNELSGDSIWLYKIDDGKIERAEFYGDTATAVKALA